MFTTPVLCVYSGIRIPNLNGMILLRRTSGKKKMGILIFPDFSFLAPRGEEHFRIISLTFTPLTSYNLSHSRTVSSMSRRAMITPGASRGDAKRSS